MVGALIGFAVVGTPVLAGWILAVARRPAPSIVAALHLVAFWVCNPALIFIVLARSDVSSLLSPFTGAFAVVSVVCAAMYAAYAGARRRPVGTSIVGASASVYTNSTVIGLPMSTFILGTDEYVAPVMLLSVLVIAPVTIAAMEIMSGAQASGARRALGLLVNPVVLSAIAGTLAALAPWSLPDVVEVPLTVLGDAAIPLVLIALGVSLADLRASGSVARGDLLAVVLIKVAVMPLVAFLVAVWMGMPGPVVLACVVMSALPTAQNLLNYAVMYGEGERFARDAMLITTALSMPVLLAVAALAGAAS